MISRLLRPVLESAARIRPIKAGAHQFVMRWVFILAPPPPSA
jgi:hypothetical protein